MSRNPKLKGILGFTYLLLLFGLAFSSLFFYSFLRLNTFQKVQYQNLLVLFNFAFLTNNIYQIQDTTNEYFRYMVVWKDDAAKKQVVATYSLFLEQNKSAIEAVRDRLEYNLENFHSSMDSLFQTVFSKVDTEIVVLFNQDDSDKFTFEALNRYQPKKEVLKGIILSAYSSINNIYKSILVLHEEIEEVFEDMESEAYEAAQIDDRVALIKSGMNELNVFMHERVSHGLYDLLANLKDIIVEDQFQTLEKELWTAHYVMAGLAVLAIIYAPIQICVIHSKLLQILKAYSFLKAWEVEYLLSRLKSLKEGLFESAVFNEQTLVDSYLAFWSSNRGYAKLSNFNESSEHKPSRLKNYRTRMHRFKNSRLLPSVRQVVVVVLLCLLTFVLSLVIVSVALHDEKNLTRIAEFFTIIQQSVVKINHAYMAPILYTNHYFGEGDQEITGILTTEVPLLTRTILDNYQQIAAWFTLGEVNQLKRLFTEDICGSPKKFDPESFGYSKSYCQFSNIKSAQEGLIGFLKYELFLHNDILKPKAEDYDQKHDFVLSRDDSDEVPIPFEIFVLPEMLDFRLAKWQVFEIFADNFYGIVNARLVALMDQITSKMTLIISITFTVLFLLGIPNFIYAVHKVTSDLQFGFFTYQVLDLHIIFSNAALKNEVKRHFSSVH